MQAKSFASFTRFRFMTAYYVVLSGIVFLGAFARVDLIWQLMDVLQILVAIPHLIGLIVLSLKYGKKIHI